MPGDDVQVARLQLSDWVETPLHWVPPFRAFCDTNLDFCLVPCPQVTEQGVHVSHWLQEQFTVNATHYITECDKGV